MNVVYKFIGSRPEKGEWIKIEIIKSKMMKKSDTLYLYVRIVKHD